MYRLVGRFLNATTVFVLLIVLAISVTLGVLYVQLRTDSVSIALSEEEALRALVVAHDGDAPFLSFLLFIDNSTGRVAVLDVPGVIGSVLRPLGRVDGIEALFEPGNADPFRRQVEDLTGVSIPFTLEFSRDRLIDFIDLLGGVELFVISDYREADGSDPVLLPTGTTRLDGEKAVRYLLQGADSPIDLEQVGRRQTFVHALLRELHRNARFLQHPDVVTIRDALVETQMETRAATVFFGTFDSIDPDRTVRRRIQGTVRQIDVDGEPRELLFPHFEGRWLKQSVEQILQTLAHPIDSAQGEIAITVEVLNGTSRTGLARRTSELFEGYGFQVVNIDNAESSSIDHTVVKDRRGIGDRAERVAEVIDGRRLVTEVVPESTADVTVILGGDFDGTRVRATGE